MWGRKPEHSHNCSLQPLLRCTCLTIICWLMHLNAGLIEFISSQILLGMSTSRETVTTVFMASATTKFVLNYRCSIQQPPSRQLQTGIGLGFFKLQKSLLALFTTVKSRWWRSVSSKGFKGSLSCSLSLFCLIDLIISIMLSPSQRRTMRWTKCSSWRCFRSWLWSRGLLSLHNHTKQ